MASRSGHSPKSRRRSRSRFEEVRGEIVGAVRAGVSIADAARRAKVAERTVQNWLSRGRRDPESPHGEFAHAVDTARLSPEDRPLNHEELLRAVSRAARSGSVTAMKLYWEILRADENPDEEPAAAPKDPLDSFDELAARRSGGRKR